MVDHIRQRLAACGTQSHHLAVTPAKRPRDVRRGWLTTWRRGDFVALPARGRVRSFLDGDETDINIPAAILDLRPEAQERLERMLVNAIGAWESNKYGQRTSLGNRASQARAVLAALFGAKKGRK